MKRLHQDKTRKRGIEKINLDILILYDLCQETNEILILITFSISEVAQSRLSLRCSYIHNEDSDN